MNQPIISFRRDHKILLTVAKCSSMRFLQHVFQRLKRRKHVNIDDTDTDLKRCLTLKRLIFIGVGKTVGVGIYVLIGVATQQAGKFFNSFTTLFRLFNLY